MTSYDDYGIPVGAYSEPESLTVQAWRVARAFYLYRIRPLAERRTGAVRRGNWSLKRWFTLVKSLVLVWWVVLYWGERGVFNGAIESCSWERWEKWVWSARVYVFGSADADWNYRKRTQTPID